MIQTYRVIPAQAGTQPARVGALINLLLIRSLNGYFCSLPLALGSRLRGNDTGYFAGGLARR